MSTVRDLCMTPRPLVKSETKDHRSLISNTVKIMSASCCGCYQWNVGGGFPRACTLSRTLSPESTVRGSSSVANTGLFSSISKPRPTPPASTAYTTTVNPVTYRFRIFDRGQVRGLTVEYWGLCLP